MKKTRILVADDEYVIREGIKEALIDMGYAVDLARDGEEAIRFIGSNPYSMVITDVKMPRADGMEVLKRARSVSPDMPVLIMTAYGAVGSAVEAMKMGAFDYILKPFSTETIETCVRKAVGNGGEAYGGAGHSRKIVTRNEKMLKLLELAKKVAASDATVLIQGENGTGKELMARFIHENSSRRGGPFVAVNCAALPENLLESELFGHEKGAFTGAVARKPGKFELAQGGTILLDEISEMNLTLQAKLLRVLQERVVDRVGSSNPVPVDIRVVATTNRDMWQMVAEEKFRQDLFYRLNVFPLTIPPLRERVDDIASLAEFFAKKYGRDGIEMSPEAIKRLECAKWPGNIRELENIMQRALLLAGGGAIRESHLFFDGNGRGEESRKVESHQIRVGLSVKEVERELILKTLDELKGNRTSAADILGISVRTLRNKLKEYDVCHDESNF